VWPKPALSLPAPAAAKLFVPVANIKSQIKRIKTNDKRRLRNKAAKSEIKTRVKLALRAAETGDDRAGEYLRTAVKKLDKAAARGIIHSNQASNRKSALMHKVALLQAGPATGSGGLSAEEEALASSSDEGTTEAATGRGRRNRAERTERPAMRPRLPRRGRRAKGQETEDEVGELEAEAALPAGGAGAAPPAETAEASDAPEEADGEATDDE